MAFLPLIVPIPKLADAADSKETYYTGLSPKLQLSPLSVLAVHPIHTVNGYQCPYPGGLRLFKLSYDTEGRVLVIHPTLPSASVWHEP